MDTRHLILMGAAAMCGCTANVDQKSEGFARFTTEEQDTTVRLQDDFYQATNGGWIAQHPVPADRSRYGTFDLLHEETETKLHSLVQEVSGKVNEKGSNDQKIGDLYALGMDTVRRNAEGLKPIQQYIDMAQNVKYADAAEFAKTIGTIHMVAGAPFFYFGGTPDSDDASMTISELWQAGLGLSDRDMYFDTTERGATVIAGYKEMLTKLLALVEPADAAERANAVFEFEKLIAEPMNTKEQNRNPVALNNKFERADLEAKVPGFDWNTYFATVGADVKTINISQPNFFSKVFGIVGAAEPKVLADYLTLNVLRGFSGYLSSDIYAITFDFYSATLNGVKEMRPLWKRTLGAVDGCMGEALGSLFVKKYFPESSKQRMLELVDQLRISFGQRIDGLTWMSDSTKAQAKEKLAAITVKIGYPDKFKDYSSLTIDPAKSYAENIVAVSLFEHKEQMEEINKPVDRSKWFMTPQTVNAYYNPTANEIVFPAAILQPPFFYAEGDDAVNYGAIGVVIGHEMTHGFDDSGCQFDKDGNLKNWWTESDKASFDGITKQMVERFDNMVVVDSLKGNGTLTLGENIADLGGLYISHQAFRNTLAGKAEPAPIDGQTAEQRFCLAYSRIWAADIRKEAIYQQVMTDPHSLGRLRVNGQLPLLDFFYEAFDVKEGDAMYMPKEQRIVIW